MPLMRKQRLHTGTPPKTNPAFLCNAPPTVALDWPPHQVPSLSIIKLTCPARPWPLGRPIRRSEEGGEKRESARMSLDLTDLRFARAALGGGLDPLSPNVHVKLQIAWKQGRY